MTAGLSRVAAAPALTWSTVHIGMQTIAPVASSRSRPHPRLSAPSAVQGNLYAAIMTACLAEPACKVMETWGFTDRHTWIGTSSHPLPFDEDYKAKPALAGMIHALAAFKAVAD